MTPSVPRLLVISMLAAVLAAAWANPSPAALDGLDAREAVELANAWKGNGVTSFATPTEVRFVFPDGTEVTVPVPEHEMLVSVAPYLLHTHPCATHFMSGCQGELVGAPVHVLATATDGTVLIDEVMPTQANGFIDLWLPRDLTIDLQLRLEGYASVGQIATFADSDTCVTTFQFAAAR